MAGHRPFDELTKDWSAERRQRLDEEKNKLLREMRLHELPRAGEPTQQDLAEKLDFSEVGEDPPPPC